VHPKKNPQPPSEKPAGTPLAKEQQARTAASAPAAVASTPSSPQRFDAAARDFATGPRVTVSPDPKSQWRWTASSVERSVDGGQTWRSQHTGAAVELLAASSPSALVCWIVGREGTVLLSTDGETWRRLAFLEGTADLVGVSAQDGLTATVSTADGRTYGTSDGGRSWTPQENPAASF
jgi:photosystem II stability/assembly factor-like uncharacterized protein